MPQTPAFTRLRRDLTQAHSLWRTYVALFTGNAKKGELLNETAPEFFGLVQDMLIAQIVLSLTRLADATKATLGFKRLLTEHRGDLAPAVVAQAEEALAEFQGACEPLFNWRH